MKYYPHRWLVLKLTEKSGQEHLRVFGTWFGGYSGSDSWKLNSGITKVEKIDDVLVFHGNTGSEYIVDPDSYGSTMYGLEILGKMRRENSLILIEELPEDTNWLELSLSDLKQGT